MRILIAGAGGMLGKAFCRIAAPSIVATIGRNDLDPRCSKEVIRLPEKFGADVVVNCAAETNVDSAEDAVEHTRAVNAILPALLAAGCRQSGAAMVQISSTGCYGDWKRTPYCEDDELKPTTLYHRTKAEGEDEVRRNCDAHLILRAGWLYGGAFDAPKNFVARRLEEAKTRKSMRANTGQSGNPTWVDDFARQALFLMKQRQAGTFNCVSHGSATRAEYIGAIVAAAKLDCEIEEMPASSFVRRAPVSPNEMAENRRLGVLGLDQMQPWRISIESYIKMLQGY